MSCSDPNRHCKNFVATNFGARSPTHWFSSLTDQVSNKPCVLHPTAVFCNASPVQPDVSICGAPCHPFSTQRGDRFKTASVTSHKEYNITMVDQLNWMKHFEPKAHILEQVLGWGMSISVEDQSTPLDRPAYMVVYLFLVNKSKSKSKLNH